MDVDWMGEFRVLEDKSNLVEGLYCLDVDRLLQDVVDG